MMRWCCIQVSYIHHYLTPSTILCSDSVLINHLQKWRIAYAQFVMEFHQTLFLTTTQKEKWCRYKTICQWGRPNQAVMMVLFLVAKLFIMHNKLFVSMCRCLYKCFCMIILCTINMVKKWSKHSKQSDSNRCHFHSI